MIKSATGRNAGHTHVTILGLYLVTTGVGQVD